MIVVYASLVEPLPHQIEAVYHYTLPRCPLRDLLADDPGAGNTIITGVYIQELMLRGALEHSLINAPISLIEEWQEKLGINFIYLLRF